MGSKPVDEQAGGFHSPEFPWQTSYSSGYRWLASEFPTCMVGKMVNQEDGKTGGGIATFANACGFKSFSAAKRWMQSKGFCKTNDLVTVTQMKEALESKTGKQVSLHNSSKKMGKRAVLYVEVESGASGRQWIYYKNGEYYDPAPRSKGPKRSIRYPKVTRVINIGDTTTKSR